ncbi:tachykinin-4 isoform X2 [Labeo rohita]|uniref:tachykinin-4 isoform X2 n=1 Tax=Labeo rohita TaxID=84645 RepID=UPI0021E2AEF9|nr:tachykinin-4 isoform X2 [Labeo rohita]XP_050957401.1 tachykinin-4 isoform X2 [Labeo rohita]
MKTETPDHLSWLDTEVGSSPSEHRDIWTVESLQEKPKETDILVHIADLLKRSKSQQFHGLMDRITAGITQPMRLGQRRNKGEIFVGLMGRRSSSGDFQEKWDRPQLY